MAEEKINVIIILEMLGRPAEHVKKILGELVNKTLKNEKGVEILNTKISEPKQLEKENLFSLFAEVEMNIESTEDLLIILFKYMPSHVEVVTPDVLRIKNDELNLFANELTKRLHQYDEIAKAIIIERNMLKQQLEGQGQKPVEIFNKPEKKKAGKKVKKKKR